MASDQQQGLLLIPDISGFTEFVNEVEISHSEHIITGLLELLINSDRLDLNLCEIEGDALFFYSTGGLPSLDDLIAQAKEWYTGFHQHLQLMARDTFCECGSCQNVGNLGLKVVAHAGEFAVYNLKDKVKVIGKDVILVHRLLKNSLDLREYLLVSAPLAGRLGTDNQAGWRFLPGRETYPVLGEVSFVHADLSPILAEMEAPPDHDAVPQLESGFFEETEINAPFARVVEAVMDIAAYPQWIEGLEKTVFDHSEPLRPGHHHVCEFPGQPLSITVEQIVKGRDEFTLVNEIKPPPVLKRMIVVDRVEKNGDGARFRQTYQYSRKPVVGRIFDLKGVPMLKEMTRRSLNNLKLLLEAEHAG